MPAYLDHNATTPLDARVLEAMRPYLERSEGNPSSTHRFGRRAKSAVEQAREQVAQMVNAHPSQIVFTCGGSAANNLAILGATRVLALGQIAVSAIEHPSVREPARSLTNSGWNFVEIPADAEGVITPAAVRNTVDRTTRLLSVMWANNETGALQPINELAAMDQTANLLFHSDAVQAIGKVPVDFRTSGVQLLSISAHKIYGPQGVGALVIDPQIEVAPILLGGGQEHGLWAGTENVAGIVGFGAAAELVVGELTDRSNKMRQLRDQLEVGLHAISDIEIFAEHSARLPNTVMFAVPAVEGETLLMLLDEQGFAVSSGSACGSGQEKSSHVLAAMAVDSAIANNSLRVSLGAQTTTTDIEQFLETLQRLLLNLGAPQIAVTG